MPTRFQHKPVHSYESRTVLNLRSGFREKLLCDGPTFSCGVSCAYSCSFCFVPSMMQKLPAVMEIKAKQGLEHHQMVLRRARALEVLERQLLDAKGRPKFKQSRKVVYASPLVDVAANIELSKETIAACRLILELTGWDIRLLSKSNLLPYIAEQIPTEYRGRLIYGVSTGTLDDKLAGAIEAGTPLTSKRIASLHTLQDEGLRCFGMICPSLPQQDYRSFSRDIMAAIRAERCEHVWAEVINVRGDSMVRTCAALVGAGYAAEAQQLRQVADDSRLWESYSRATFLAHAEFAPAGKLRFLQYINRQNRDWWTEQVPRGAVLLGRVSPE